MIEFINNNPYVVVVTVIATGILLIINELIKEYRFRNKTKMENEELKKILYRNKDFKGKPIEYYAETRRERLIRIFDEMDATDQRKLCDYAERMERDRENREYYK